MFPKRSLGKPIRLFLSGQRPANRKHFCSYVNSLLEGSLVLPPAAGWQAGIYPEILCRAVSRRQWQWGDPIVLCTINAQKAVLFWIVCGFLGSAPAMGSRSRDKDWSRGGWTEFLFRITPISLGCHADTEILTNILDKRHLLKKKQLNQPMKQTKKPPQPKISKSLNGYIASCLEGILLLFFLLNLRINQWWISFSVGEKLALLKSL